MKQDKGRSWGRFVPGLRWCPRWLPTLAGRPGQAGDPGEPVQPPEVPLAPAPLLFRYRDLEEGRRFRSPYIKDGAAGGGVEKKTKRRKASCKAKTRNPPCFLQDQKGQLFSPLPPTPSPLFPGQACTAAASSRKIVPSPVGLQEEGGCLLFQRACKAPTILEHAPPPAPGRAGPLPRGFRTLAGILGEGGVIRGRGTNGVSLRHMESFFHEANISAVASP